MMMMYLRWLERALVITCMAAPFCSAASGPKRDGAIVAVGTLSNEPISESVHEMDGSQVNRVDKDEENTNIAAAIGKFVATDEWQVIAEGTK